MRLAVLGTVLGGLLLAACGEQTPPPTLSDAGLFLDADGIVMGGDHHFTKEGVRTAFLVFDTAYQWRDSTNISLRGVNLTVYEEGLGTERARVTSRSGTMDSRGERLTARGDVVLIVPADNRRITTQELHYDPQAGRIWSDSAFVMEHGGRTTRGRAFRTDTDFVTFTIVGTGS